MEETTRTQRALALLVEHCDVRDAFLAAGLFIAGVGGCMLSVPWTLVAIGAVLTLKAIWPGK